MELLFLVTPSFKKLMIIVILVLIILIIIILVYNPYLDIYRDYKDDLQIILWYTRNNTREYIKILGDL